MSLATFVGTFKDCRFQKLKKASVERWEVVKEQLVYSYGSFTCVKVMTSLYQVSEMEIKFHH